MVCHILSICQSVDIWVINTSGLLQITNVHIHVFGKTEVLISLGCVPGRGMAGSCGVPVFNLPGNCQTGFQAATPFFFQFIKKSSFSMSSAALTFV